MSTVIPTIPGVPAAVIPTAQFASLVYGGDVPLDDPAEAFHEASRLYPNVAPPQPEMLVRLEESEGLQQTVARASRTHPHRPGIAPPAPAPLAGTVDAVATARRSERAAVPRALGLAELAALLAGYRSRETPLGPRRGVPSAGALYPLELYLLALRAAGVPPAAYHYDPFAHRLEVVGEAPVAEVAAAFVDPTSLDAVSLVVVVTGVFWRSRCKYSARGYRFTLLEAGHLAHSILVSAAALGLAALPIGGFFDRRLDRIVGADSLDESSLYALAVGGRA